VISNELRGGWILMRYLYSEFLGVADLQLNKEVLSTLQVERIETNRYPDRCYTSAY
jgi:hypothetical protein